VAGTIRYFASRHGALRAAIEGTGLPLALIKRHARRGPPTVEYRHSRKGGVLYRVTATEYLGFVLDSDRTPLTGAIPRDLVESARGALTTALMAGTADHPHQQRVRRALDRLGTYWRRSGGALAEADPVRVRANLMKQLRSVESLEQFMSTPMGLDVEALVSKEAIARLDSLPGSAAVFGDRVPLDYEIENGKGVARIRLRMGQARRLQAKDVPALDRPLRFTVLRGRRPAIRADTLEELHHQLAALPPKAERHGHRGRRRRGRPR